MRNVLLAALLVVTFAVFPALAADTYDVRAFIEPSEGVTETTEVRLVIEVRGESTPTVKAPRIGKLKNLTLVSGPQTSSRFSWTNGRASSSYQLIYSLLPETSGPAEIPSIEVSVESRVYRTEPIRLDIGAAAPRAPQRVAPGRPPQAGDDDAVVFLKAELGSDEVWVGQPVPLTVTLYSAARVSNFGWRQRPDFANFWVESVDTDIEADTYRTRIGGRVYNAYPVETQILIPPGPGTYELEPYIAQVQVRSGRGDPFDWFRLGRTESILRKSEPLTLEVRQLPEEGMSPDFSGAVGSYTLRVQLDRENARVNDAVALKATVQGEGALRSVDPPLFDAPADFKVFDSKVKESIVRTDRGKVTSRKTWEWILIPLAPGDVELPGLEFHFFDPEKARYLRATTEPLLLAVERGDPADDVRVTRSGIQPQRRDLAFIKFRRGELALDHPRAHETSRFLGLLALPLGLAPLVILVGRRQFRLRQDVGLARSRKARSRARKKIRASGRHLDDGQSPRFHEEVGRALVGYVADRFNRSPAGLTYDVADGLLASRGVDPALRRRFRACLESCDFARFVPSTNGGQRRSELLGEAADVVDQLERAW